MLSQGSFQTNPRGVGGRTSTRVSERRLCFRPTLVGSEGSLKSALSGEREFQTNPRGVGGRASRSACREPSRFRPTLVGSEGSPRSSGGRAGPVSDQPSWGRRYNSIGAVISQNTVSDQPSWGRRGLKMINKRRSCTSFRPTLVGSEGPRGVWSQTSRRVSDQPSWGRRAASCIRLVAAEIVSDQPSWGRRTRDCETANGEFGVSDQPSWGRRYCRHGCIPVFIAGFRPTLVGSEVSQPPRR